MMLILLCLSNDVYAESINEQRNVLVINSYHQGFTWSKDETDGIIDGLKKSNINLSIYIEYMDWKNYPTNENLLYQYRCFEYKYQNKHIDLYMIS